MPDPKRRTARRIAVGGVVVVAAIAAGLVVWFLSGSAPGEVDIDAAVGEAEQGAAGTEATASDGIWVVDTSVGSFSIEETSGTFVGVRVEEELANIGENTAVVRTPEVSGSVQLDGTTLVDAVIEADLTALVSNESRRDRAVQRTLDTANHPTATFQLTDPVELEALPEAGSSIEVDAVGDLTINGVTDPVEVPLEIGMTEEGVVVVTGSFEITFADYEVQTPTAQIVLSVQDHGVVELQLFLSPS